LTAKCPQSQKKQCLEDFNQTLTTLKTTLDHYIFGEDSDTLESVIHTLLKTKKLTLAIAESLTGGSLTARIVSLDGASQFLLGSVVCYSTKIKVQELGVSLRTIENYGVDSEETAIEMAQGIKNKLGADIGLATTGLATPNFSKDPDAIGKVCIGFSFQDQNTAKTLLLEKNRGKNIERSTTAALDFLRENLV
jgi:nicotinamide-nucleotide amidase